MADIVCVILFWSLLILGVLSLIPFRLERGLRSRSLMIPVLSLLLYGLYERAMWTALPIENVPIRIDVLLVWPVLTFIMLAGVCRLGIILRNDRKPTDGMLASTGLLRNRALQLKCFIPCIAVSALVAYLIGK